MGGGWLAFSSIEWFWKGCWKTGSAGNGSLKDFFLRLRCRLCCLQHGPRTNGCCSFPSFIIRLVHVILQSQKALGCPGRRELMFWNFLQCPELLRTVKLPVTGCEGPHGAPEMSLLGTVKPAFAWDVWGLQVNDSRLPFLQPVPDWLRSIPWTLCSEE